ncbi:TPA: hypothetical protein EYO77_01635, partial [Candidatus Poribacteria bacterium]|nr:hypothetical protein [Candidatus Poribacteria bacterium]
MALSFHEEVGSSLSIFNDSNLILTYNYHSDLCKPYFHPVNAPNAKSVTSDTPEDNINHHGLWFGWGNVNGIDFWKEGAGKITHREFRNQEISDCFARVITINNWSTPKGTILIEQTSEIIVHEPLEDQQIIDLNFSFHPLSEDILLAASQSSYGLCYRSPYRERQKLINSDSRIGEWEANNKPASWCDFLGLADNITVGTAIFDHPSNPRYPAKFTALDESFGFISPSL